MLLPQDDNMMAIMTALHENVVKVLRIEGLSRYYSDEALKRTASKIIMRTIEAIEQADYQIGLLMAVHEAAREADEGPEPFEDDYVPDDATGEDEGEEIGDSADTSDLKFELPTALAGIGMLLVGALDPTARSTITLPEQFRDIMNEEPELETLFAKLFGQKTAEQDEAPVG